MKNLRYILILFFLQQNIVGQNDIIGKIEYYKSIESDFGHSEKLTDKRFKSLNNRKHYVEIKYRDSVIVKRTNKNGIFKFELKNNEIITIQVYKKTSIFNKTFEILRQDYINKDTINLRISEKKLYENIDSLQAPEFFKKFNVKVAELDFKNGNARILGSSDWLTEEIIKKREKLSKKYNFKYEYIFGCLNSQAERRIAYRYNKKMKELIGIKNVW